MNQKAKIWLVDGVNSTHRLFETHKWIYQNAKFFKGLWFKYLGKADVTFVYSRIA